MLPSRHFELVHEVPMPRASVWQVLSHTDRLNRQVGLPAVKYGDLRADDGEFFRPATSKLAGMMLRWREYPFTWEKEGRYSVVRVYDQGPIARFEGGIELLDAESVDRTRLRIFSDIAPRGAPGVIIVPLIARQFLEKTVHFCEQTFRPEHVSCPAPAFKRSATRVNESLLDRLTDELGKRRIEWRYAQALRDWLRTATDDEVSALRPYEWAQSQNLKREEALRTCLHATKVGMLNLRWAMMCPNCRVVKSQAQSLDGVENQVHCDLCGISYNLAFDRYVELKFAVHPAIRRASNDVYCIGGPFTAPHVVFQTRLNRGERGRVTVPATGDKMRLRVLRSNHALELSGEAPEVEMLTLTRDGWSDGTRYITRANWRSDGTINVENASGKPQFVLLERVDWDDMAATAAQVTALQEFRDLFSSEVLRPGRQIAVENVTLFFSDLANSTALYETIGDAPAYGRIGTHFDFIFEHIASHRGAVVKTMGDAVMAVFHHPQDAVEAAIQTQRHFRYFRETMASPSQNANTAAENGIELKIGLHTGPALAVNSNDRLDYFGRTVNIAARVVGQGRGGDIVVTQALWENPDVRQVVCGEASAVVPFQATLRGVEESFDLVRIKP